jgi:hypothetical protein
MLKIIAIIISPFILLSIGLYLIKSAPPHKYECVGGKYSVGDTIQTKVGNIQGMIISKNRMENGLIPYPNLFTTPDVVCNIYYVELEMKTSKTNTRLFSEDDNITHTPFVRQWMNEWKLMRNENL